MRSEPMAERLPDGLGTGGFAGVVGQAQAGARSFSVKSVEWRGAGAALVAAQADADDGGVVRAHLGGLAEDALGLLDGEVADGVEDPIEGEVELAGGALAGALQAGEDGLEGARIEVAPHIDDADGDVDLGVDHALVVQVLHHAPCRQFVILGVFQASRNGLEALNELGEVREAIERFRLRGASGDAHRGARSAPPASRAESSPRASLLWRREGARRGSPLMASCIVPGLFRDLPQHAPCLRCKRRASS